MSWLVHNHRFLSATLERLRLLLEHHAQSAGSDGTAQGPDLSAWQSDGWPRWTGEEGQQARAYRLCERLQLTRFERDILMLCVGLEVDGRFADLCARAHGNPKLNHPSFSLALAALPGAHWSATAPSAALRRWELIEVEKGPVVTVSRLRTDERVWQYLLGIDGLDQRVERFVQELPQVGILVDSHQQIAAQVASTCVESKTPPIVQLFGSCLADQCGIAVRVSEHLRMKLCRVPARLLPTAARELDEFIRIWKREVLLDRRALLLDCHDMDETTKARGAAVLRLVTELPGVIFLVGPERRDTATRHSAIFEVQRPTPEEQRGVWRTVLTENDTLVPEGGDAEVTELSHRLAANFDLDSTSIEAVSGQAQGAVALEETPDLDQRFTAIWDASRAHARPRMANLAQHVRSNMDWDDLILPDNQMQVLREVEMHARYRAEVLERWGFGDKTGRGNGTAILLAGPSGVGKTLAAEVLANRLRMDLWRIDLSAVVSKYIGETEKNLRRVFDAVEGGGSVLLFDEADALFGRRSAVKDSHDRYANIEVGYLLQRMEAHRGLAVLTTNLKAALDPAFIRRLRFIVDFPFPDKESRTKIWERVFPPGTPKGELRYDRLGQLNVSGAVIRNVALHAAFLAADEAQKNGSEGIVEMRHILAAAEREYQKVQQPLSRLEIQGWIDDE